jgi:catechol 2,3-dioxygenase-like lactoylglutathione lyase family enzyme
MLRKPMPVLSALASLLLLPVCPAQQQATTAANAAKEGAAAPIERGRILGIGGVFFKSANQQQTREWYAKHLGIADKGGGAMMPWREKDNPEKEHVTVWTVFPGNTRYFEPGQAFMVNYIVDDLDALLERLQKEGVKIDPKRQNADFGRFAWIYDPDGNKIELWQPLTPTKK